MQKRRLNKWISRIGLVWMVGYFMYTRMSKIPSDNTINSLDRWTRPESHSLVVSISKDTSHQMIPQTTINSSLSTHLSVPSIQTSQEIPDASPTQNLTPSRAIPHENAFWTQRRHLILNRHARYLHRRRPFSKQRLAKNQLSSSPLNLTQALKRMQSHDTGYTRNIDWTHLSPAAPFYYNFTAEFQLQMMNWHRIKLCVDIVNKDEMEKLLNEEKESKEQQQHWLSMKRTLQGGNRNQHHVRYSAPPSSSLLQPKKQNTKDKYFQESKQTSEHTDKRFTNNSQSNQLFRKIDPTSPEINAYQDIKLLFHAWNNFTAEHRFTWWIAHGALIGWYWNQQLLPWDVDIDVQTTLTDFQIILVPLNQTVWQDRYLLDINPHSFARQHQPNNVIDARFIDMENGLYVDITVLSLLQVARVNSTLSDAFCSHATIEPLLVCKSPHIYTPFDIFPLRQTVFENIQVYRPNDVYSVLKKEYGAKSMTSPTYKRFQFIEEDNQWQSIY